MCVCACVAPVRHTDWSEPQKEVTAVRCMQRNARHKHLHALSTLQRTQRAFHQRTRGRSTRGEKAARLTHRTQHGALGWAGLAGLARLRLGLISCTYARYGLRARASPGSAPATWNTCLVPSRPPVIIEPVADRIEWLPQNHRARPFEMRWDIPIPATRRDPSTPQLWIVVARVRPVRRMGVVEHCVRERAVRAQVRGRRRERESLAVPGGGVHPSEAGVVVSCGGHRGGLWRPPDGPPGRSPSARARACTPSRRLRTQPGRLKIPEAGAFGVHERARRAPEALAGDGEVPALHARRVRGRAEPWRPRRSRGAVSGGRGALRGRAGAGADLHRRLD